MENSITTLAEAVLVSRPKHVPPKAKVVFVHNASFLLPVPNNPHHPNMHGPAECAERLNNKRGQCAISDKTSFKTKQSQEYAKPIAIETP